MRPTQEYASKMHQYMHDEQMLPVKTVGLLCSVAFAVLLLGLALSIFSDIENTAGEEGALSQAMAMIIGESVSDSKVTSTPREMWKKGSAPKLYQTDSEWSEAAYGGGTIGTHGCGPTCLAMAYVALTGADDMDPKDMAEFSEINGFIDEDVTSWALMSEGAELLGLESEELPASAEVLRAYLNDGIPVICSVHEGDFTTDGHFIVLVGIAKDGNVEIRDPNSPARTSQTWDLQRIINQCDNIWAISLA